MSNTYTLREALAGVHNGCDADSKNPLTVGGSLVGIDHDAIVHVCAVDGYGVGENYPLPETGWVFVEGDGYGAVLRDGKPQMSWTDMRTHTRVIDHNVRAAVNIANYDNSVLEGYPVERDVIARDVEWLERTRRVGVVD